MKKSSGFLLGLCLCVLLMAFPALAYGPVQTEKDCSVTLAFGKEGGFPGVSFRIYRTAEISAEGSFRLTGSFADYPVSLKGLDSSGWRALAQTLEAYTARDHIEPLAQGVTGEDGRVSFYGLPTGLYLVCGDIYKNGSVTCTPQPVLISLPSLTDGEWNYEAGASVKYDTSTTPGGGGGGGGKEEDTVTLRALKVWRDEGYQDQRPEEVTVQLLDDGELYDEVVLNEENNWRHTWEDLEKGIRWQLVEEDVPEGYTVSVRKEGITFVAENTRVTELEDGDTPLGGLPTYDTILPGDVPLGFLPQTGQLWWPVPILAALGLILFAAGWARERSGEEDYEQKQ